MLKKINKSLRIIIIILLITLAVLSVYYKFDNCNKCSFDYEGEKLSPRDFMDVYNQECFVVNPISDFSDVSWEDVEI